MKIEKRRNLSGVFLMHQFDGEEKPSPTVFEDCPTEKQAKFLESLDDDGLIRMLQILSNVIVKLPLTDDEKKKFLLDAERINFEYTATVLANVLHRLGNQYDIKIG